MSIMADLDDVDRSILAERSAAWDLIPDTSPRIGDVVRFADGVERYVSHIWLDADEAAVESVQTSDGGSFHLAGRSPRSVRGGAPWASVSFSGQLYRGIPGEGLRLSADTRDLHVWFFHHDRHVAHNAVDATVTARVFDTDEGSL